MNTPAKEPAVRLGKFTLSYRSNSTGKTVVLARADTTRELVGMIPSLRANMMPGVPFDPIITPTRNDEQPPEHRLTREELEDQRKRSDGL